MTSNRDVTCHAIVAEADLIRAAGHMWSAIRDDDECPASFLTLDDIVVHWERPLMNFLTARFPVVAGRLIQLTRN
jgi:hypothetical protein